MSWQYAQLYLLDSVTAPTLWVGLGLGLVVAAVVLLLWDRDRRRLTAQRNRALKQVVELEGRLVELTDALGELAPKP